MGGGRFITILGLLGEGGWVVLAGDKNDRRGGGGVTPQPPNPCVTRTAYMYKYDCMFYNIFIIKKL